MSNSLSWGDAYIDRVSGKVEKYFPYHDGQRDFLQSPARIIGVFAGSGGGKTSGGALWVSQRIKEDPTAKYLIVSPTYSMFHRSVKAEMAKVLHHTKYAGVWNETYKTWKLPQGGVIICLSADCPERLASGQYRSVWIDEGSKISGAAWTEIQARTRQHRGRILITTTPDSFNWCYHEVYCRWLQGDENYHVTQFSSFLNPTWGGGNPKEEYERAKATMSEDKFRMYYDGAFTRSRSLIYPTITDCLIEPYQLPRRRPNDFMVGGIDFGFKDKFAAIAGFIQDDILYLIYERYISEQTLEQHAAELPRLPITWYADNSRPDSIKSLRRAGFNVRPCRKGAGSIEAGIEKVESRIRTGRLKILREECINLIGEAETYHYMTDENGLPNSDTPAPRQQDHLMDSLRYLIASIDAKKTLAYTK